MSGKNLVLKFKEFTVEVRSNEDGLYCLNDIFRASGLKDNKKPSQYTRNIDGALFQGYREGSSNTTYTSKTILASYAHWLGLPQEIVLQIATLTELCETIDGIFKLRCHTKEENGALCAIEQVLGVTLRRQYTVIAKGVTYRLDGYDVQNKVAYEIDEPQHFLGGELRKRCKDRQRAIEEKLGCVFIRIKV